MIRLITLSGLACLAPLLCCVSFVPLLAVLYTAARVPRTVMVIGVALIPLTMYGIASTLMCDMLRQPLSCKLEQRVHDKQGRSLTLAGFSLTSLAILLRFYGLDITGQEEPSISLALSLGFFIATYLLLRYRMKEWADYASDALLDSGLWCILLSLAFLFWRAIRSGWGLLVMVTLMAGFLAYVAVHLAYDTIEARSCRDANEKEG
jgi:hypothetical protein